MSDASKIEWTDATWNIITGCSVVSPGCTNCYAMRLAGTRLQHDKSREGLTTLSKAGPVWNGEVRFNEQWLTQPLRWRRPRRIFVCAHGDLFHESVPDEWIDRVFAVMALAPQHTFQVLTKRTKRMRKYVRNARHNRDDIIADLALDLSGWPKGANPDRTKERHRKIMIDVRNGANVWLGASVEDQTRADERIPDLLATPAAMRFISAEPLLGPIDFSRWMVRPRHIGQNRIGDFALDDEIGAHRGQQSHNVTSPIDTPVSNRLSPSGLNVAPPDVAAKIGLKPFDHFARGAVDRKASAIGSISAVAPVEVPLSVKQPGDISDHGDRIRNNNALREPPRPDKSTFDADALNPSLHGRSRNSGDIANLGDGFSGAVEVGKSGGFHANQPTIDCLICGGESGPGARPMHPDWARSLRDQCAAAGVPFFFKQHGDWIDADEWLARLQRDGAVCVSGFDLVNRQPVTFEQAQQIAKNAGWELQHLSNGSTLFNVGKRRAGRLLDGVAHDGFPAL